MSAVVLAYGPDELLARSLSALSVALHQVAHPTEVIVVLNRVSAHNHDNLVRSGAILIEPGRNLGFAAGVNAGVARASGRWVALINDDCVVEPSALAELLAGAEHADDVGSVAAQIRFADSPGVINSAGISIDLLGIATERLLGAPGSRSEASITEVFGASAAAGLYRRTMLDEIGGFDESFFAYLEDADVAWRARMAGWRCVYAPSALAYHHHSASLGRSSPKKHFLVGRNRVRMLAKNATQAQLLRHGLAMLAYDCCYVVFAAFATRSIAPLIGRCRGLQGWAVARKQGRAQRRPIAMSRPDGFRHALRRWNTYRSRYAGFAE